MNTEIFKEMRQTKRAYGRVSTAWLQSRFKMSYNEALRTLANFEDSIVVPFRKNGKFAKQEG